MHPPTQRRLLSKQLRPIERSDMSSNPGRSLTPVQISPVEDIVAGNRIAHIAHLGAVLPSVSEVDPAQGVRLNVGGTANVLEAARRCGVKPVVMASSKAA